MTQSFYRRGLFSGLSMPLLAAMGLSSPALLIPPMEPIAAPPDQKRKKRNRPKAKIRVAPSRKTSGYPHQGSRECARRRRQIANGQLHIGPDGIALTGRQFHGG